MSLITTYKGHHFDPMSPKDDLIDIDDIAHALSLQCRGNGQVTEFFSVGQHCILCCREALSEDFSPRMALICLLHDAGEAYLSDVPRPLKENMPGYVECENNLIDAIYKKFLGSSITPGEEKILKIIDDAYLWYDLKLLLNDEPITPEPDVGIKPRYGFRPFKETEDEYLQLFNELNKKL